jgi:hypothetical protein
VQCLVEGPSARIEPVCEHVDRDAVDRERDEDAPLVLGEDRVDRLLERRDELALLDERGRLHAFGRERAPRVVREWDLAPLPRALAQLHCGLEEGELVGPGREAARAAKVVEPSEDADEGVVGRLLGEIVEIVAT